MGLIRKTGFSGYFSNRRRWPAQTEQLFGKPQPAVQYVFLSSQAHQAAEKTAEVILAQVRSRGDFGALQFRAEIGLDVGEGFLHSLVLNMEITDIWPASISLRKYGYDQRNSKVLKI
jgi:hypothetical protein